MNIFLSHTTAMSRGVKYVDIGQWDCRSQAVQQEL